MAARISAVFARDVAYADQPEQLARQEMLAGGLLPWQATACSSCSTGSGNGACDSVTGDVRAVTGADPRPLEDWLGTVRGAFPGRPPDLPAPRFV